MYWTIERKAQRLIEDTEKYFLYLEVQELSAVLSEIDAAKPEVNPELRAKAKSGVIELNEDLNSFTAKPKVPHELIASMRAIMRSSSEK